MAINKGDKVKWKWGQGYGEGKVEETYTKSTTRKIKGTEVTRNGSKEDKALYIKQEDGDAVLKLESEVEKI
jgi:ribosomal protein L24